MPCDQRITTSVVELTKVNRERLAVVLGELGWRVTEQSKEALRARGPRGEVLRVTAQDARLSTSAYADSADKLLTTIRQAYALRTVQEVTGRFGFRQVAAPQTLQNGAKRLVMRR